MLNKSSVHEHKLLVERELITIAAIDAYTYNIYLYLEICMRLLSQLCASNIALVLARAIILVIVLTSVLNKTRAYTQLQGTLFLFECKIFGVNFCFVQSWMIVLWMWLCLAVKPAKCMPLVPRKR